jgi:hypothetical protein
LPGQFAMNGVDDTLRGSYLRIRRLRWRR